MSPYEILCEALHSSIGIVISTSDARGFRQKLYIERNKHPEFKPLRVLTSVSNPEKELWIVRGPAETHAEPEDRGLPDPG